MLRSINFVKGTSKDALNKFSIWLNLIGLDRKHPLLILKLLL